jgi:serine/threonine protein kinase
MGLQSGTRLGPYEIVAPLGAGGMGEVYRARDARLKRDVALKVLPDTFATDIDRLARFEREAQVLASLNHPHIAGIYGIEEGHGTRALVMELVEGPTLADRIAQGPIPAEEALPIARQIADALEAAHEQGIIHRDLKPANIKLRPDGTVKVLDFGLAKAFGQVSGARDQGSGDSTDSPTITSPAVTHAGVILGTAAYMSPEQAKGKAVDKRADIWAFGCVVYEMLIAKRPFDGDSVAEALAAVLTRDPDLGALPDAVSAEIRALVARCLRKNPSDRLRDIGDARILLDDVINGRAHGPAVAAAPPPRRSRLTLVALAAILAAVSAVALLVRSAAPPLLPQYIDLALPAGDRIENR